MNDTITSIRGVRVGHATAADRLTGCTVVRFDRPLLTAVDARGGAPGTLETDRLGDTKSFPTTDAILLSGGSAYGLDAAAGVRRWLAEQGRGWKFFGRPIPLVSAAIVLDLGVRQGPPDAEMAYQATAGASEGPVVEGNVGAGMGCTVGKLRGIVAAMKGGVGSHAVEARKGIRVGAIAVVNAVGNVVDPANGRTIAGTRREGGGAGFVAPEELEGIAPPDAVGTTIVVVATNAKVSHGALHKVAEMAHDGLARSMSPSHMTTDGDVIFAAATGEVAASIEEADLPFSKIDWIGHAAATCVAQAVLRGVRAARTVEWKESQGGAIPGLAG